MGGRTGRLGRLIASTHRGKYCNLGSRTYSSLQGSVSNIVTDHDGSCRAWFKMFKPAGLILRHEFEMKNLQYISHFIHFCISRRRDRLIGFCAGKPLCEAQEVQLSLELRTGKSLLRASLLASRVATLASRVPGLQCLLVIQIANMHFAFSQFLLQLSGSVWTGATTLNGGGLYFRPSMENRQRDRT